MKSLGKTMCAAAIASSIIMVTTPASAVDIGIGAGLATGGYSEYPLTTISIPVRMQGLVIEPEVGYYNITNKNTDSVSTDMSVSKDRLTMIGLGLLFPLTRAESFETFIGARLMYGKDQYSYDSPWWGYSGTVRSRGIGPTVAAEYSLSKSFSVSVDTSLLYIGSRETFTYAGSSTTEYSNSRGVRTETRVMLRAYF